MVYGAVREGTAAQLQLKRDGRKSLVQRSSVELDECEVDDDLQRLIRSELSRVKVKPESEGSKQKRNVKASSSTPVLPHIRRPPHLERSAIGLQNDSRQMSQSSSIASTPMSSARSSSSSPYMLGSFACAVPITSPDLLGHDAQQSSVHAMGGSW